MRRRAVPVAASRILTRRRIRMALGSVLGVLLLLAVARSVPLSDLQAGVRPAHAAPLVALVGLVVGAQLARAVRWSCLLSPLAQVPLLDALWINAASGFLNYVVPVRAGEAARVVWLSRRHRVAPGTALGCMVIDHAFDLCGVIAVLGIGAILNVTASVATPPMPALLLALAAAIGALAAIVTGAGLGPRLARCRLVPARFSHRLAEHTLAFRAARRVACSPGQLAPLAAVSAVAVVLDGVAFAMLFRSLGLAVSLVSAIVAQVTLLYAYLLPSAPGYLGSLEAAGTLILSHGLGLRSGPAAGAMILWHAAGAAVVLGLGGLALFNLRGQFGVPPPLTEALPVRSRR